MKKTDKTRLIKTGSQRQRFVFKKFNKQLISMVGVSFLLLGNYALVPIQVFAGETLVGSTSGVIPEDSQLSTLKTSDPLTQTEPVQDVPKIEETEPSAKEVEQITESTVENSEEEAQVSQKDSQSEVSEWVAEESNGYMVISAYTGDGVNIIVPSQINDMPVQINLATAIGNKLRTTTRTFEIEESKDGLNPVKLMGTFYNLFRDNKVITTAAFADADTTAISDMERMFFGCSALVRLDASIWNTQNVRDMSYMFYDCNNLTSLDVSNWNVQNVRNMNYMFYRCSNITSLDVSNWDTRNVQNMYYMFFYCSNLTNLDVSNWNTENVQRMNSMFTYCSSLISLDVSNWDIKNVLYMTGMFADCSNLTNLDVSNWDTRNVQLMGSMFAGCSRLTGLDLSNWNTRNVQFMTSMFADCTSLASLDLSNWSTESIESIENIENMFLGCNNLTELKLSEPFQLDSIQQLRELPSSENEGKTNYHWVKDDAVEIYDSTTQLIEEHNSLSDGGVHVYTIQKSHEVSFVTNNEDDQLPAQKILEGDFAQDPDYTGTKDHHQLESWMLDGQKFNFEQMEISAPITLIAKWRLNQYTVRFNENGGTGTMVSQTLSYDEEQPLSKNTFERTGYSFKGWSTEQDGKDGEDFADQVEVKNLSMIDGEIIDLYAQWEVNQYNIKFDSNGGSGELTPQKMTYDLAENLTENNFTRKGYRFTGWNTQADGKGDSYSDKQEVENLVSESNGSITLFAQWNITKYNVTFDSAGGSAISDQNYTIETGITEFATPTRKGFTFLGWYDGKTKVEAIEAGETGNRTLTAKWEANQYNIKFDSNGGSGELDPQQMTYDLAANLTENKFTRKGYSFTGWNTQADGKGDSYSDKQEVENLVAEPNGSITLFAQWKMTKYNVTFDSAGGSTVPDQNYTIETGITNFDTPTRKGFTFLGWYDGEKKVETIEDGETGDRVLIAKWEANQYSINFDSNGGSGELAPQQMTYDLAANLTENKFTRKGYSFTGWNTQADGKGDSYSDKQEVENLVSESNGSITLFAQWEANQYSINFDSNGGSGELAPQQMTYDLAENLPENKFTQKGYGFIGWNTEADGKGSSYSDKQEVKNLVAESNGSITLFAQWEANQYSINFDSNGGSGEFDPQQMTYDLAKNLTENKFTRSGYTFLGWNTQADGTGSSYSDKQEVKNLVAEPNGSITLFAQWKMTKYNVTFDSAGGSTVPDQNYTIETGITNFDTPTRKGFTFLGWYDGEKKVETIEDGETGDRVLIAKWEANQYSINFDSNGGSGELAPQQMTYDLAENLPENKFTQPGYTFLGWNTQADGTGSSYSDKQEVKNLVAEPNGSITLFAQWEMTKYNVTFDSAGGSTVPDQNYTIETGITDFVTPTRKGFTFVGWYDEEKKVEAIEAGETGDRTLTAQWEIIEYTITFDNDSLQPITYTVESDVIKLPTQERNGYTFLGWLVSEDTAQRAGTDPGEIVQEIQSGTTGNLMLSAQWEANQYSINFDSNGGSGELAPQQMTYDLATNLSENKFTRSGYTFLGWNTQAAGTGTSYSDKQEVENLVAESNGSITLFAQWETNKSALEDLVNKEKENQRDKEDYTEESWKNYEEALAQAKKVLADDQATAEQTATALEELKTAIANLELLKTSDGQIIGTANDSATTRKSYPSAGTKAKSFPQTGMIAGSGLMIVGIAVVGAALAGWKKRKGK